MPMLKPKVSWFLKFWVGSLVVLIWETHTRMLTKILRFQGSLENLTRIGKLHLFTLMLAFQVSPLPLCGRLNIIIYCSNITGNL